MNEQIDKILAHIRELEDKLEQELEKGRAIYGFKIKGKVAEFEKEVIERHSRLRQGLAQFFIDSGFLNVLTAPVIYSLIIPMVLADIWVTFYQHICFRAYGIPRVIRSKYVIIDRHHLRYLNWVEVLNCAFCSYSNGVISYTREIASRTEQYWCPIKHALRIRDPHERYLKFLDYGDAEGYRKKLEDFRKQDREPKG